MVQSIHLFFCHYPNPCTYFCVHVFCITLPQMAWLGFFPNYYVATGNWTHVSSVAPLWGTLTQDALLTELPRPRLSYSCVQLPSLRNQRKAALKRQILGFHIWSRKAPRPMHFSQLRVFLRKKKHPVLHKGSPNLSSFPPFILLCTMRCPNWSFECFSSSWKSYFLLQRREKSSPRLKNSFNLEAQVSAMISSNYSHLSGDILSCRLLFREPIPLNCFLL